MMKKHRDLEDLSCPYCGRFYFMPDSELLGMQHVHLRSPAMKSIRKPGTLAVPQKEGATR